MITDLAEQEVLSAARNRWLSAADLVRVVRDVHPAHGPGDAEEATLAAVKALLFSGELVGASGESGRPVPWGVSRQMGVYKAQSVWGGRFMESTWFVAATAQILRSPGSAGADAVGTKRDGTWVQITRHDRLRATLSDAPAPHWKGSGLRVILWAKRIFAGLLLTAVTAVLLGMATAEIVHSLAPQLHASGVVTAVHNTTGRGKTCDVAVDYTVGGRVIHGHLAIGSDCHGAPKAGAAVHVNLMVDDPQDVWLAGTNDARHQGPAFPLFMLVMVLPVGILISFRWLIGPRRVRELLATGETWHQVEAKAVHRITGRDGTTVTLEAPGEQGEPVRFKLFYRFRSPLGRVATGEDVTFHVLTAGTSCALVRREGRRRIAVAWFS